MPYFCPMIRKIAGIICLGITVACGDGDLQIDTLDFDSVSIGQCGSVTSSTEIFFKIDDNQALILDLKGPKLPDASSAQSFSVPGQVELIYRIFDGDVSSAYFCDDIPPVSPNVTEEIEASAGTVNIVSTLNDDETSVDHVITFEEITLINVSGERITDLTINNFGTVTTTP